MINDVRSLWSATAFACLVVGLGRVPFRDRRQGARLLASTILACESAYSFSHSVDRISVASVVGFELECNGNKILDPEIEVKLK